MEIRSYFYPLPPSKDAFAAFLSIGRRRREDPSTSLSRVWEKVQMTGLAKKDYLYSTQFRVSKLFFPFKSCYALTCEVSKLVCLKSHSPCLPPSFSIQRQQSNPPPLSWNRYKKKMKSHGPCMQLLQISLFNISYSSHCLTSLLPPLGDLNFKQNLLKRSPF